MYGRGYKCAMRESSNTMTVIIPGDTIEHGKVKTTIGPGLYRQPTSNNIIPVSAGFLHDKTNKQGSNRLVYIDSNSKRYVPQVNDFVIGVVTGVIGEAYKVLLQDFSSTVLLSMMAFPNANKKNRPNLKNGQAVYARVTKAISDIESEIECMDSMGKEGGFGVLNESGFIFDVSLHYARELLFNQNSPVLEKLSSRCKFEIAIGINGRIWIKCGDGLVDVREDEDESNMVYDIETTLAAATYIKSCALVGPEEFDHELSSAFKGL